MTQSLISLDLKKICHPRPPGSKMHLAVRDILLDALLQLGLEPYHERGYVLPYHTDRQLSLANVAGVLPGRDRSLPAMLLGAHYDTVPGTPGADDNASALWVVLNAVAGLKSGTLDRSVIVALFDAEEPPHFMDTLMGSTNFYRSQLKHSLHCTFIFDLVGHDVPLLGMADLVFITGMESHVSFEGVITGTAPAPGIRIVPALNSYVGDMSDHHVFRISGEPYLFFSCGRWEHYHASSDTVDRLNFPKMEALSSYIRDLVVACDRLEFPKGAGSHDTTEVEARFMNEAFRGFLKSQGIPPLRTRKDIDNVAELLVGRFGL